MRTFRKKTAGPVDQPGQPRQPMAPRPPKPLTISNTKELREALAGLRTYKGLSLERLNENATAAGEPLPPSTVTSTLRRDQLPSLKFVTQYLQACGLSDDEQTPWGEAWHAVNDGVAPVKRSRNWTQGACRLTSCPAPATAPVDRACHGGGRRCRRRRRVVAARTG